MIKPTANAMMADGIANTIPSLENTSKDTTILATVQTASVSLFQFRDTCISTYARNEKTIRTIDDKLRMIRKIKPFMDSNSGYLDTQ